MSPLVSINLCCYNSEKYLDATLQTIFAQTFRDWELVIVNDGSSDATEQIIQQHCQAGWPIVYHYQENAGLGNARNKALSLSSGEFVAFIDHDDLWLPEKLAKQVPLFENPKVGLVYSDAFMMEEASGNRHSTFSKSEPARLVRGNARNSLLAFGGFLCLSTAVVRQSIFSTVGVFDPTLRIVEDTEMWFRIADVAEFDCCPEPLAIYRVHPTSSLRTQSERHWQETVQLSHREIRRGNMSRWAYETSSHRILEYSWVHFRSLWRSKRYREASIIMAQAARTTRFDGVRWLARKFSAWGSRKGTTG